MRGRVDCKAAQVEAEARGLKARTRNNEKEKRESGDTVLTATEYTAMSQLDHTPKFKGGRRERWLIASRRRELSTTLRTNPPLVVEVSDTNVGSEALVIRHATFDTVHNQILVHEGEVHREVRLPCKITTKTRLL